MPILGTLWVFIMSRRLPSGQGNTVIIGRHGAGKKTLLQRWREESKLRSTGPTMGANMDILPWNATLFSYEGSGHPSHIRSFLRVTQNVSVILLLVASDACAEELEATRDLLNCAVCDPRFADAKVLVACNRQDVHGAASRKDIASALKLKEMDHRVEVLSLSALTGFGVDRLFDALLPWAATLEGGLRSVRGAPSPRCARRHCGRAPPPSAPSTERRHFRRQNAGRLAGARSSLVSESPKSSATLRWQKAARKISTIHTIAKAGMGRIKEFWEDDSDGRFFRDILDKAIDIAEESTLRAQLAVHRQTGMNEVLAVRWRPVIS